VKDWHALGTAHRRRDDAASSIAHRRGEIDDARFRTALARWPAIVAAIKTTLAAYNRGMGRELLAVTEADRPHPSATIESSGGIVSALVITLDGAEIRVDCRATAPDHGGMTRWVALTRSDDDTAAYVLQDWMERL
jgi:hypothetical protein